MQHEHLFLDILTPRSPDAWNPFQYSCLGNLMDKGAWWAMATVHGVARVGHHRVAKPPGADPAWHCFSPEHVGSCPCSGLEFKPLRWGDGWKYTIPGAQGFQAVRCRANSQLLVIKAPHPWKRLEFTCINFMSAHVLLWYRLPLSCRPFPPSSCGAPICKQLLTVPGSHRDPELQLPTPSFPENALCKRHTPFRSKKGPGDG